MLQRTHAGSAVECAICHILPIVNGALQLGAFCGPGTRPGCALRRAARQCHRLLCFIPGSRRDEPELGLNPGVPLFMGEPRQRTKILTAIAARLRAYYDDLRERFAHEAEEILSRAEQQKRD